MYYKFVNQIDVVSNFLMFSEVLKLLQYIYTAEYTQKHEARGSKLLFRGLFCLLSWPTTTTTSATPLLPTIRDLMLFQTHIPLDFRHHTVLILNE